MTSPGLTTPGLTKGDIARRRLLMLAPLGVVAAGGVAFWTMLSRMQTGQFDPHDIGNPMLGKPMPDFNLPDMAPGRGFTSAEARTEALTHPLLINFFASWCIPCASEADTLGQLSQLGMDIWGIAYKDTEKACDAFLQKNGNPYRRLAADTLGRTFIDFGLFGVPESFLIDRAGIIRWHIAGPIDADIVEDQLIPVLKSITS